MNEYFRRHKDEVRKEVDEIKAGLTLPENVDPEDYAWRVWVANKCREFGGLSVLCHPYWVWNQMYFMSTATTELLLRNSVHDALDWTTTGVDLNAALWADLRAEGLHIPLVCSTDSHSTDCTNVKAPAQGGYTLLFAPDRTAESIKAAVRAERSLAVNDASTPETIYGPYRLVKFATFLMDNYFPAYARLCYGQGAVMCEYPVNGQPDEETVQLLTLLNKRSEAFAKGFFGY